MSIMAAARTRKPKKKKKIARKLQVGELQLPWLILLALVLCYLPLHSGVRPLRSGMKRDRRQSHVDVTGILIDYMSSRGLWEPSMRQQIPTTVENYGGLLLFTSPAFSHPSWREAGDDLWRLVCSSYKGDRVGIKGRIKDDEFRSPQAKLVFGSSPLATITDNGIHYRWNIEKTMFSRGNVTERHRIARLDCKGEVIVDLFAGIGYFTVPYLVHAKAERVHACEWNPDAIIALRDNLKLNKVSDRCTIYEGDNREVCPKRIAHRVNLGLIPSSEISWETACQALLPEGGVLYVHQNVESNVRSDQPPGCAACTNTSLRHHFVHSERNFLVPVKVFSSGPSGPVVSDHRWLTVRWKWREWYNFSLHLSHSILNLVESSHGGAWSVYAEDVFRVKSYAPHVDHLVFAVKCEIATE